MKSPSIPGTVPDLAQNNWNFLEVWVDPMQSPPYVLLLLGDKAGSCHIFDPAEQSKLITSCENYDQAKLWLLKDEYEPLESRLTETEINAVT